MTKKTGKKEKEKIEDSQVDETDIPIEVVDEESASDSGNVLQLLVSWVQVLEEMPVDDYLYLQNYHIEESKRVLSNYIGDGHGRLVDPADAMKLIGSLTLKQLTELITQFFLEIRKVVVPKVNGSASEST